MTGSLDAQTVRDALDGLCLYGGGHGEEHCFACRAEVALARLVASVEALTSDNDRMRAEEKESAHDWSRVREAAGESGPTAIQEVLAVYMATRTAFDIGYSCAVVDEVRAAEARVVALTARVVEIELQDEKLTDIYNANCKVLRDELAAAGARVVALTAERDEARADEKAARTLLAIPTLSANVMAENVRLTRALADALYALQAAAQRHADLTSVDPAAKVPPVQAAPDSPREDASAPEGTAT